MSKSEQKGLFLTFFSKKLREKKEAKGWKSKQKDEKWAKAHLTVFWSFSLLFHPFLCKRRKRWEKEAKGKCTFPDVDIVINVLVVWSSFAWLNTKLNIQPPALRESTRPDYWTANWCPLVLGAFRRHAFNVCNIHLYCCTSTVDTCNYQTVSTVCIKVRGHGITPDIEVGYSSGRQQLYTTLVRVLHDV